MANDNVTSAVSSLQEDLDFSSLYGKDTSEGTVVAKTIENVEIRRNEQGKWEKTVTEQKFPAKKDVNARADELEYYENATKNLTEICAESDKELFDIVTQINSKKQLIMTTISSALSAGCSCVLAPAIANGVTIGIGSTVHTDYASINEYSNISGNSQNPFGSDNEKELTSDRLGNGYKTNFEVNGGVGIGSYRNVTGLTAFGLPSPQCLSFKNTIDSAATEIASLRSSINGQLINETNTIKDKKTEYELFAWSYKNTDNLVSQQRQETENVLNIVKSRE